MEESATGGRAESFGTQPCKIDLCFYKSQEKNIHESLSCIVLMLKITLTFTAYGSCCLTGVAQGIFSKHDATGYGSKMLYRTYMLGDFDFEYGH